MPDPLSSLEPDDPQPETAAGADAPAARQRDPVAVELGRRGGLKGGKARAARLTPEQRKAIAMKAAFARWGIRAAEPAAGSPQGADVPGPTPAPAPATPDGASSRPPFEVPPDITVPVRGGSGVDWPAIDLPAGRATAPAPDVADQPEARGATAEPRAPEEPLPARDIPQASSGQGQASAAPATAVEASPQASTGPRRDRPAASGLGAGGAQLDGLPGVDGLPQLGLIDWRRRVADLYSEVRLLALTNPEAAWQLWCVAREALYRRHPLSPVPADRRSAFTARHFPYNPELRFELPVRHDPARPETVGSATKAVALPNSGPEPMAFERVGRVEIPLGGTVHRLSLFWIPGYAGGLFLPFRDGTNGSETYGAGRYLLDTAKGADLGAAREAPGSLVVDFNFAFQPSCAFDPRWACPLAPAENRINVPIRAGERLT